MDELLELALIGVASIVALLILIGIAVVVIQVFTARSVEHIISLGMTSLIGIHQLGINAIIGANEMKIVDASLEDKKT
jgi:hypothetical protein